MCVCAYIWVVMRYVASRYSSYFYYYYYYY